MSREKNDTEGKIRSQIPNRWAGAGRECRAGIAGRAGMGRAGGGTCVFLHKYVRRNRLECRFGAEYRGESPVIFTGFFPGGTRYFPRFTGFFPRKTSGEFEGKIRFYQVLKALVCKPSHLSQGCDRDTRARAAQDFFCCGPAR